MYNCHIIESCKSEGGFILKNKRKLVSFAILSSLVIFAAHLLNRLIFYYATIKDVLFSDKRKLYVWRFGNIYYTKQGDGLPLLLIHDLTHMSSDYEWKHMIAELSKEHTIYTIDLLGCGRSDKPKVTYTNYLYVQMINDFIKDIIKGKTDIISSGSSVSPVVMACHSEPEHFNRLMFINPDSMNQLAKYPKANHKALKYLIEAPIVGTLIYNMVSSRYHIKKTFAKEYFADANTVKSSDVSAYREAAHLGGISSKYLYASICSHFINISIINAIKKMNHSIYIIGGEREENIGNIIDEYVYYNQSIETSVISDAKHLPQLEKPEEVLEICSIFFTKI